MISICNFEKRRNSPQKNMKRKSDRTGEHPNLFDNCCFPEKKMASIRIIDKKNDRD